MINSIINAFKNYRNDINGKEEYFNTSVMVLLTEIEGETHILFEKRNPNIRQGNEICLPGGMIEPNENAELAALRETSEELGIDITDINLICQLDTSLAPMGVSVEAFLGKLNSNVQISNLNVNKDEVSQIFTLPISYFIDNKPEEYGVYINVQRKYTDKKLGREIDLLPVEELGLPDRYQNEWGGFKHKVFLYKTDYGIIWGITARIINNFINTYSKLINN